MKSAIREAESADAAFCVYIIDSLETLERGERRLRNYCEQARKDPHDQRWQTGRRALRHLLTITDILVERLAEDWAEDWESPDL